MIGGVSLGIGSAVVTAVLFFLIRRKLNKHKKQQEQATQNQNNGENQAGTEKYFAQEAVWLISLKLILNYIHFVYK